MSEKLRLEQEDLDIEKTQVPKVVEFPDTTIPTTHWAMMYESKVEFTNKVRPKALPGHTKRWRRAF